jgi:Mg-chelatase subunit ChlD
MDSVSFSYLLAHPTSIGVTLERPILIVALAALVFFHRFPAPGAGRLGSRLRATAFALAVAAAAGLSLTTSLPADQLGVVAAVDVSGSMDDEALEWAAGYVRAVQSSLAPGDQLAIVTFAESPEIRASSAAGEKLSEIERPERISATDIGAAIDQSLALYSQEMQKALLLISDGNETVGNSRDRIETLRALSVRVDAIAPPRSDGPDIRLARLAAPDVVAPEKPVPLRIVIHSASGRRPAVLNLYLDGLISDSLPVELHAGLNRFDLLLEVREPGGHVVRGEMVVEGEERLQDNSRETTIYVREPTTVLLASSRKYSPIAEVLSARGLKVTKVAPPDLPQSADGYDSTHLVVMEDVRGRQISSSVARAIEEFVRDRGGGLVFAGDGNSFGDPDLRGTPIETMLPVTLEPHRPRPGKRDPLALFLVIDRSNSMGFNSRIGTLRDGEKLRYAIKAGVAVVKQLKDHDSVGIIAFDARPHEIAPLRPLKVNRDKLLDALPRIVESGGTDFYDALVSAGEQLSQSRVTRKHVVLLTDGDTNRAGRGEYRKLIARLAGAGISVTTIRIGDNTVNLKLLQEISEGTGGSFHHVEDAQMLPDLMLRDTSRALSKLTPRKERYLPAFAGRHQMLTGTDEEEIPPLDDYAFSKPKPNSETLLQVARSDRKDPILSVWRYGLGRVAAFTASPSVGAETWPAWSGFARFWSQMASWAARSESEEDFAVEAIRHRDSTKLIATTFERGGATTSFSGRLDIGERFLEVAFSAVEPGRFEATTIALPAGRYPFRIRRRSGGEAREIDTVAAVPTRLQEEAEEYDHSGDNLQLMRELTLRTGGTFAPSVKDVTDRPTGTRTVSHSLAGFLIPLVTILFFADIALRRVAALRSERAPSAAGSDGWPIGSGPGQSDAA